LIYNAPLYQQTIYIIANKTFAGNYISRGGNNRILSRSRINQRDTMVNVIDVKLIDDIQT